MLGTYCTNRAPTTPPQGGGGSYLTLILMHNSPLLLNRPTRAIHNKLNAPMFAQNPHLHMKEPKSHRHECIPR